MQAVFALLPQGEGPVREKPENFRLRQPNEEFLSQFRQDPAFDYTYRTYDAGWEEIWSRWFRKHFPWLRSWNSDGGWIYVLLEIGACVVLFFLIYHLVRNKYRHSAGGKRPDFDRVFELEPERVDEVSYPVLLERALNQGDYLLAVRIHFWYMLGLLEQKGMIRRDAYRSNAAYLQDISSQQLQKHFAELVRIFDCVCYGDFQVDEGLYESLRKKFIDFQQVLTE